MGKLLLAILAVAIGTATVTTGALARQKGSGVDNGGLQRPAGGGDQAGPRTPSK